jgi:LCP family protein required for cell wall assembly
VAPAAGSAILRRGGASFGACLIFGPHALRTTLKRGVGRGGVLDGNGHSILPPSALTPMTRYRQPEPPSRSRTWLIGRILFWLATGILVVVLGGVSGIYLWLHEDVVAAVQAHSADVKSAKQFLGDVPPPGHAAIALVIGYDHRANETAGTPSRSDTVMLLRTDPATKSISMFSFPRDLVVNVHCPGRPIYAAKINAAYSACGAKGTVQTVHDLIGLPINYLITVNFRGFKEVVNKLGGVWIDVDRRYFNSQSGSCYSCYATINLQPGYQLLTGGSALDYVRYRHTDSDLYRVARQQQFVKAVKYQFRHNFSLFKAPGIIHALVQNMEIASGGGGDVSGKTILSYARFIYGLPGGHFFQTQIQGLTGYADLRTDPANIQAAVQDWLTPDIEAASVATDVALGRKVKTKTPAPEKTSITVLNGNGIAGSAGSAGYALAQRGYRILELPPNATGNAPSFDYFHTTVYWNPRIKRSQAAAASVAKLLAPADVKRITRTVAPLGNSAMVTVVVGQTFKGTIAPAAPPRVPTKRQPPHVVSNPYDTAGPLRAAQKKVPFALMVPTVIESSSGPDSVKPLRAYRIHEGSKAVRLVFRTGTSRYWGIEETAWDDAPVLTDRSFRHVLGGRKYDFYYDGAKLHMIVLRYRGVSYWVVNTLLDELSNETMIAIAKGLRPLKPS